MDDDGTGELPAELNVSNLRLSHALMKLEEIQHELEARASGRRADFVAARDAMRDAAARLGDTLPAEYDEIGKADLTGARLGRFRAALGELQSVEAERAAELARLAASSRALALELEDSDAGSDADDDYVRADGSVLPRALGSLGASKLARAKRRLTALRDEKASRLSRLSTLGEEISLLWERLDVDEAKQLSFREAVKKSSIGKATFRVGEAELGRLRDELGRRVGDLVAKRRAKICALWDEMAVPEAARREKAPFAFNDREPDEAALAAHEALVAALEARKEAIAPLLKLVERREELLAERAAVKALQKDPTRLTRRGPGAAAERKYENDCMRRIKALPKLTEKLFERLVEWEQTEPPVLHAGARYLDKMAADKRAAAAERAEALKAKQSKAVERKQHLQALHDANN